MPVFAAITPEGEPQETDLMKVLVAAGLVGLATYLGVQAVDRLFLVEEED